MEYRLEPDGDVFRVGDSAGETFRFSAYLLQEAEEGDGTILPEEWDSSRPLPSIRCLYPWGPSGAILQPTAARIYLERVRRKFRSLFSRAEWVVVVSPALLEVQGFAWLELLKKAGFRRFRLQSSLEYLALSRPRPECSLHLHWGLGGGDLGLAFRGRVLKWTRLHSSENDLRRTYADLIAKRVRLPLDEGEAGRIFRLIGSATLESPTGQLVEILGTSNGTEQRCSLSHSQMIQMMIRTLEPVVEQVESFLRQLGCTIQADLFEGGLSLSGGGLATTFLGSCLEHLFEIPILLHPHGEWALVRSDKGLPVA